MQVANHAHSAHNLTKVPSEAARWGGMRGNSGKRRMDLWGRASSGEARSQGDPQILTTPVEDDRLFSTALQNVHWCTAERLFRMPAEDCCHELAPSSGNRAPHAEH